MKISLKWLSEYVEVPSDLQAFCDKLDLTGTGVEGVDKLGATLDGVVVGHVKTCEDHPDSDHMHVAMVDVGGAEPLQIVCGAPNIKADMKVAVATIGTVMPEGFKIKKSKLRGVASCGMCCSERELGLGTDHEGIWELPSDAPVGMPVSEYAKLADTVLDLEITPNRPDCLCMQGFAREVGAMYKVPVSYPKRKLEVDESLPSVESLASVKIEDETRCQRYTARVIKNVKVGPSPDWLAERVVAAGARSINNVVDVTNYILFLLGQPLHAFDYDKLKGADNKANIIVRAAKDGEKFTTLDGEERELTHDMTLISTPSEAVALAGVMGGLDSEVTDSTTTILLESAAFESGCTSRTSRNLGLISESSMRYERGVDDNTCEEFSAFAASLLAEVSGGSVCPGVIDVYPVRTSPNTLSLRVQRCNKMLGAEIDVAEMKDILERLGCEAITENQGETLKVITPTFRPDLEREIDLYEEILRLYGMDKIEATLPESRARLGVRSSEQVTRKKMVDTMRACGLNETMTYSFASPNDIENLRLPKDDLGIPVALINPLNADQSVMRQSIIPGLLNSVSYNQNRGVKNIQLFEMGTVFYAHEGQKKPRERAKLAGVMAGAMGDATWNTAPAPFDFFDGKGVVESLARELVIPKLRFKVPARVASDADTKEVPADNANAKKKNASLPAPHLQPGRGAYVYSAGSLLGWVGEIHPSVVAKFDATAPVVAFELDVQALLSAAQPSRPYVDVPQFPAIELDVAFVVSEDVPNERMEQVITSAGGKLLESVRVFDVYHDDLRVGKNKKSVAYKLTYRAGDKTLTSEEVQRAHNKVIKKVSGATGAEVRA